MMRRPLSAWWFRLYRNPWRERRAFAWHWYWSNISECRPMLQHMPAFVGQALRASRSGLEKLTINRPEFLGIRSSIIIASPAFQDAEAIPRKYTADGDGLSPPLSWEGVAPTQPAILIIEDADSPTPSPLVHAIVLGLPTLEHALREGALPSPASAGDNLKMGRNSYLKTTYLPPDPPPGHGPHRYAFQIFVLEESLATENGIGRSKLIDLLRGRVRAKGCLIGSYERPHHG
jgi:Raf kinase inhibitor-like YbhB/YbcL family protein